MDKNEAYALLYSATVEMEKELKKYVHGRKTAKAASVYYTSEGHWLGLKEGLMATGMLTQDDVYEIINKAKETVFA